MIELTERLLADAGGWQAMKEARSLHGMGRVAEATWEPPVLLGRVRAGETEYRAGLRILSRSNVENLCTCRDARQRGVVCAHALAVGLEILKPQVSKPPERPAAAAQEVAALIFTEDGEPLELALVLAPNLAASWEKSAVMVGVEAITGGRRVLLSAVDARRSYRASEVDQRLVGQFVVANGGVLPGMLMLPRVMFAALLGALAGHPRVTFGKTTAAKIVAEPAPRPDPLPVDAHVLVEGADVWLLHDHTFTPLLKPKTPAAIDRTVLAPPGETPAFFLKIEGSLSHLTAELESRAGNRRTTLGATTNHPAEQVAIERLLAAGFTPPGRDGLFVMKGEPRILAFFATELPRLEKAWTVTVGARFEHVTRDLERISPRFEVRSSGENWFDLSVELATPSGERFSSADLQRLLQSGQRSVRIKNQKTAVFDTALLDEFQQVLQDCDPAQKQPGLYRIAHRHAGYLAGFASEQGTSITAPPEWQKWVSSPGKVEQLEAIPLGSLETVLRPYQKQGVYWLNFLMKNGFSGLLADEMGLGKTVQILALFRIIRGKYLVICPSSLVFNWQREAQRFAPDMRTATIVGSDRAERLREAFQSSDLLISSYPLLRRDIDLYRRLDFDIAVLDEAQNIKNPDSQNAQSACALRARHRFALSGTPIENSVRDLWSLMQFLMPGYLGSREDFRDRYQREIESDPGGPANRRLLQRVRPFALRRTKRNVLSDLPDKIEQIAYCELSNSQAALYAELATAARRQVSELTGDRNAGRARMLMLTALLRLRQACCDARLLPGVDPIVEGSSGKIELLHELLNEAIDGGHRVLIFSQFVAMLTLLRQSLESAGIPFCYLDGQTRDRGIEVDRFQTGDAPAFLISLKAGGTGLNLTGADTVIHFDPWWNPAVEDQATDRTHRIGQRSIVNSYKLIARGTVEEKILVLQQRKRAVMAGTLESEEPLMDGLSQQEIRELLS